MAYISIDRKLFKHFLWTERRPKTKFEAWIDLIQLVSFEEENELLINGTVVRWERGEYPISYSFLADRWIWSFQKVRGYLVMLKHNKQINTRTTGQTTILTLCNYDGYNPKQQSERKGKRTRLSTGDGKAMKVIKEDKEDKEVISFNFYAEEVKKAKEFSDTMSLDYITLCNHICQKDKNGTWLMPFVLKIDKQISLDNFSKLYEKTGGNLDSITSKIDSIQNKVNYHNQYSNLYLTINTWLSNGHVNSTR
jgi:hypothetical protein